MANTPKSREDWELRQIVQSQIDTALKTYDERLWERIKAHLAEHVSPKLQQLFFGYGLLKWVAGVVVALAIGTIWQIITSVGKGGL